jgi:hypothetical protein
MKESGSNVVTFGVFVTLVLIVTGVMWFVHELLGIVREMF